MIFLDLTKAYDALDRSRCLGILEGYGVGPGARRLLRNYWRRPPWWLEREATTGLRSKGNGE